MARKKFTKKDFNHLLATNKKFARAFKELTDNNFILGSDLQEEFDKTLLRKINEIILKYGTTS